MSSYRMHVSETEAFSTHALTHDELIVAVHTSHTVFNFPAHVSYVRTKQCLCLKTTVPPLYMLI